MFKKKPQIKNLSPLRSSDRRGLADQIIRDYGIPVPPQESLEPPSDSQDEPAKPQTTLSSLRNLLLPESTSSARFITTFGPDSALVSGTVYVGAHRGEDDRVLWIQYEKNTKLVPTVYTLWNNPNIVPLLHTPDFVAEQRLRQGADLMIPGLIKSKGTRWDPRAKKGSVVAVSSMRRSTVPLWVGTCEIDVCNLGDDLRGQKGIAVKGLHWEGDEIWNWSALGNGGKSAPEHLDGWTGLTGTLEGAVYNMTLDDSDENGQEDGGVALDGNAAGAPSEEEEEREPTTKEVDEAFHEAFLYSLHKAKQSNKAPHYGFDFPIQPSFLIANMIQPHLRVQSQQYAIKKTSWKNAKKFIKQLDKEKLLKSKDRNGGETVIVDMDFDDHQVTRFTPYKLPTPKAVSKAGNEGNGGDSSSDPSLGQKIAIKTVYRVSSKLVPTLLPSKTEFYTAQQVFSALKEYIDKNPELGGQGASSIKLDPFIANNILGSNLFPEDSKVIAAGRIQKGALQRRVLEDSHLCQPFHVIERNQSASEQKPKAGPAPQVHITIEKRTGTKVVTKIANLEPFFINPQQLAPELQKKCAGAASVAPLTGGKPGLLEIVVQGDQRKVLIGDVLAKRGIDVKWVDVVDKTKAKKK
ncbi:uncharacterized protein BCR38DRAFT_415523 [Pseudomassariella vexata]|uniref:SUI1 domain-containing protein n=1 Tax=Pseudomassariella vexata TaxID=1141098 RepID=A0A1Y2EI64_9PEZI|nr:uncharacterized protein BCR38DRAFT_415523 [Pseudomassariella vexata]ORY70936.1 hypothetical protein BCR38DRAFT_415523 [Pseudomassariella vexata]